MHNFLTTLHTLSHFYPHNNPNKVGIISLLYRWGLEKSSTLPMITYTAFSGGRLQIQTSELYGHSLNNYVILPPSPCFLPNVLTTHHHITVHTHTHTPHVTSSWKFYHPSRPTPNASCLLHTVFPDPIPPALGVSPLLEPQNMSFLPKNPSGLNSWKYWGKIIYF